MANAQAVFTPGQRLTDETGVPYSACEVYFYEAGTTTPKTVYADADLAIELGAVVYTDSAGYPVISSGGTQKTIVYTDENPYKISIRTSAGVVIAEHDSVKGAVVEGTSVGGSFLTQDAGDVRYTRNANALSTSSTLVTGDKFPFYKASAAGNRAIDWSDISADLLAEWRTSGHIFSSSSVARIVFQATPPTGWTLETGAAYNDAALKFTTGTPGTVSGVTFSNIFKSQTFTGTVGNDTPTVSKTAAHTHTASFAAYDNESSTGGFAAGGGSVVATYSDVTTGAGSGAAHDHGLTMNAFNMAIKTVSCGIGVKS